MSASSWLVGSPIARPRRDRYRHTHVSAGHCKTWIFNLYVL